MTFARLIKQDAKQARSVMISYDPSHLLISLHIAKTAGTSFGHTLHDWFGERLYWHYFAEDSERLPHRVPERHWWGGRRKGICVHGHFERGKGTALDQYYPDAQQFLAFLREPAAVHLSLFQFQWALLQQGKLIFRGQPQKAIMYHDREGVMRNTLDVDEFFENGKSVIGAQFPFDWNADSLERTIEDKFIHLGAMELYENSVTAIAEKLVKRKPPVMYNENKSPDGPRPTVGALSIFQRKHSSEYALWEYALKMNA